MRVTGGQVGGGEKGEGDRWGGRVEGDRGTGGGTGWVGQVGERWGGTGGQVGEQVGGQVYDQVTCTKSHLCTYVVYKTLQTCLMCLIMSSWKVLFPWLESCGEGRGTVRAKIGLCT